ncbi:MAG: sulfurtransferase complex subunit TusB [Gammaproteobacteria bacterium]
MLHIISRPPLKAGILGRIDQGDAVILIEDAVTALLRLGEGAGSLQELSEVCRICALEEDLGVRGIEMDEILSGIEILDYRGFVALTVEHPVIYSWC